MACYSNHSFTPSNSTTEIKFMSNKSLGHDHELYSNILNYSSLSDVYTMSRSIVSSFKTQGAELDTTGIVNLL